MKKTNKANFKKIVGGVLAAVMAAAMVATAVIPAFAAEDIPVVEEVPEGVSAAAAATAKKKNVSIVVAKQVKMKDEDVYLGATPAKKGKARITNSNSKVGSVTTYKQKGSSLVWYYFKPTLIKNLLCNYYRRAGNPRPRSTLRLCRRLSALAGLVHASIARGIIWVRIKKKQNTLLCVLLFCLLCGFSSCSFLIFFCFSLFLFSIFSAY